jgi:hypothetical protein
MYKENASAYCTYNATNRSNIVCIINNQSDYQYEYQTPEYLPEYSMDVPLSSYMYTLFLAFGCYSFLNPASARKLMMNTLLNLAKYSIIGYGLFKENVYKPYVKHVHPKLLRLLNIDDGINEIVVVKNGKVIHTFKTMEMFVKNNPIKFVKEFSDDSEDEDEDEEEHPVEQEHSEEHPQEQPLEYEHKDVNEDHSNTSEDISDKVDYNKKCQQINELIDAFKLHSLNDTPSDAPASEVKESEETEETDKTHENEDDDDTPDDYILDPTAFDFIIRNFYYEDEKTGETHSYVFKYDIFYKSEMNEKYDVDMIKSKYFSTRKFIGLSLKTNEQKYVINLTSPNNYYVSDNCILNYSFLKWYMMKHYNVKLSCDYVVSGIDNYVEMYKINPGKKIFVHKNRFEIVDDETFVTDDEYIDNHEEGQNDNDNDNETETEHHNETETETDSETHDDASNTQHKNDSTRETNNNLEERHEMCDIEILDYD